MPSRNTSSSPATLVHNLLAALVTVRHDMLVAPHDSMLHAPVFHDAMAVLSGLSEPRNWSAQNQEGAKQEESCEKFLVAHTILGAIAEPRARCLLNTGAKPGYSVKCVQYLDLGGILVGKLALRNPRVLRQRGIRIGYSRKLCEQFGAVRGMRAEQRPDSLSRDS
jgi:hypothetical protein